MYYFYDVKRARVGDVKRETEQRESESATDRARDRKANEVEEGRRRRREKVSQIYDQTQSVHNPPVNDNSCASTSRT